MSEILDDDDVYRITRRKHLKQQIQILNTLGIRYWIHPVDNVVIIPKSSVEFSENSKSKREPKWQETG